MVEQLVWVATKWRPPAHYLTLRNVMIHFHSHTHTLKNHIKEAVSTITSSCCSSKVTFFQHKQDMETANGTSAPVLFQCTAMPFGLTVK